MIFQNSKKKATIRKNPQNKIKNKSLKFLLKENITTLLNVFLYKKAA